MTTYSLKILSEAATDIKEAAAWYKEISQLLSIRFVSQVYDGFAKITANPDAFFNFTNRVKRYHLTNFPFLILFYKESDAVVVFAVIHERKNPKSWKRRLRKK